MDTSYEGFYSRFESPDKAMGSMLMGPDNLVGDDYTVDFRTEDGRVVAWLKNKFGADVGYLDVNGSRRLQLANARDQQIRVLLSFVAYSDEPDPGLYWGEMAVICFNQAHAEVMNAFADRIAERLAEGNRPKIDLGSQAVKKLLDDPEWLPAETVPLPEKKTGSAVLKDHRTMSEKMIEQGRARNKGCYAISILFIVVVVALVVFGIARLAGLV